MFLLLLFYFIHSTETQMVLILSVPPCVHGSRLQWQYQSAAVLKYNRQCHSWTIPGLNTWWPEIWLTQSYCRDKAEGERKKRSRLYPDGSDMPSDLSSSIKLEYRNICFYLSACLVLGSILSISVHFFATLKIVLNLFSSEWALSSTNKNN